MPVCVREVVEKMPMERRIELDQAATDDENIIARSIIEREVGHCQATIDWDKIIDDALVRIEVKRELLILNLSSKSFLNHWISFKLTATQLDNPVHKIERHLFYPNWSTSRPVKTMQIDIIATYEVI